MASHKLDRLLRPKTIAVFGGLQAAEVIRQSQKMGFSGEIWPVHPSMTKYGASRYTAPSPICPAAPTRLLSASTAFSRSDIVRELRKPEPASPSVTHRAFWKRVPMMPMAQGCRKTGRSGRRYADHRAKLLRADQLLRWRPALARPAWRRSGWRPDERGVAIITQSSNIAINMTMQTARPAHRPCL